MSPIKRAELLFNDACREGLVNPVTGDGMPTVGMVADAIATAVAVGRTENDAEEILEELMKKRLIRSRGKVVGGGDVDLVFVHRDSVRIQAAVARGKLAKVNLIKELRAELKDVMKKWNEALNRGFKVLEDFNRCVDQRNAANAALAELNARCDGLCEGCSDADAVVATRKAQEAHKIAIKKATAGIPIRKVKHRAVRAAKLLSYPESPGYKKSLNKIIVQQHEAEIASSLPPKK